MHGILRSTANRFLHSTSHSDGAEQTPQDKVWQKELVYLLGCNKNAAAVNINIGSMAALAGTFVDYALQQGVDIIGIQEVQPTMEGWAKRATGGDPDKVIPMTRTANNGTQFSRTSMEVRQPLWLTWHVSKP